MKHISEIAGKIEEIIEANSSFDLEGFLLTIKR